jgi:hypothetical protein
LLGDEQAACPASDSAQQPHGKTPWVQSIIAVICHVAKQLGDSALDDPALLAEGDAGFDAFAHDRGAIPR